MENPLLLCEVANLHQREVEKEVVLRQITNQVKAVKIYRPGLVKRFIMALGMFLKKIVVWQKRERFSPDEPLILNINL